MARLGCILLVHAYEPLQGHFMLTRPKAAGMNKEEQNTVISICKNVTDLSSSCEITLEVKRGTTQRVVPGQHVTVSCPGKHCGKSLNVTWCKVSNTICERIRQTENIEISQNYGKDELISFLSFKHISIIDDGLYKCKILGNKDKVVGHSINISVSDRNQGAKNDDNVAAASRSSGDDDDGDDEKPDSWLPYFYICSIILLLVATVTVLTLLHFFGWKRTWTPNYPEHEKSSTHMIPNIPQTSTPTSPVLQTHLSVLKEIYGSSLAETTTSSLSSPPTENQPPIANTTAKGQASNSPVYAVINHQQRGTSSARKQPAMDKKEDDLKYAVVNLP
ncbi:B- and T-lymphocyte attenuator [Nematolebias whitei]|uniref:B- and T-lymphocyte attenuator n=1 Tax=Nematolebias whitei TaxID=451745 RepID=UPI001899E810|nr:B- and T-lymphocyte attenuator [Nematolebias whitei]